MLVTKALDLPIDEEFDHIRIVYDGTIVSVEYGSIPAGTDWCNAIQFMNVNAYRFQDFLHSRGFIQESIDAVVEVHESEWLRQLLSNEPREISGSVLGKKHFAVLLSGSGYLEVIATSVRHASFEERN